MALTEEFPTLKINDKLVLREQRFSDAADFFNYISKAEVKKYILSYIPVDPKDAEDEIIYWIDLFYKNHGIYWAITIDDVMCGSIGLHDINLVNNRAEISYDLCSSKWQQGITSLAMTKVLEFCFDQLNINRIQASTIAENIGSIKVLEKAGFKLDGTLKQYRRHNGKYYDILMYSIIKSDYDSEKSR